MHVRKPISTATTTRPSMRCENTFRRRPDLRSFLHRAHGLAPDGKIEINVIAAKPGSAAGKRHRCCIATAFRHQPQAVKAGDLLPSFLASAAPAATGFRPRPALIRGSLISRRRLRCRRKRSSMTSHGPARPEAPRSPTWCGLFLTDTGESSLRPASVERRLGGRPLPFSAVEVPGPLPVPGATVMMEAWVMREERDRLAPITPHRFARRHSSGQ